MQRICKLSLLLLGVSVTAFGQGTPGVLRCAFQGSLDVHATREPSSPIVARIKCGDPVLLIEQQFGSPHIRTEDGKDGYIVGMNFGQWSIEPQTKDPGPVQASAPIQPTPVPVAVPQPQSGNQSVASSSGSLLLDGTPLRIRLNRNLSSADAKVGETVDFEVLDEIKVSDVAVLPKGATAFATVTEAQKKRSMGRGGKLDVNIDHVRLADGAKVPLRAIKENQGGGHVGAMTGAIVATSIVFFPAAPLFLFMKGKDITIPKGTEVTAYVNGDFTIDLAKFRKAPDQGTAAVMSPVVANESVQVAINSSPDGADITVDGRFIGNTPANVRVTPGEHVISLEKIGFRIWQRTIQTTAGSSLTVAPTLDKNP